MLKIKLVPILSWSKINQKSYYESIAIYGMRDESPMALVHVDTFYDHEYQYIYDHLWSGKSIVLRLLPDTDEHDEADINRGMRVVMDPPGGLGDAIKDVQAASYPQNCGNKYPGLKTAYEWMSNILAGK